MIKLAHGKNFFPQAFQNGIALQQSKIENLYSKMNASFAMNHQSDHTGDTFSKNGPVVNTLVDIFNISSKVRLVCW
jgi:hypothetical protein